MLRHRGVLSTNMYNHTTHENVAPVTLPMLCLALAVLCELYVNELLHLL
jgi:hypothetical protein